MNVLIDFLKSVIPLPQQFDYSQIQSDYTVDQIAKAINHHVDESLLQYMFSHFFVIFFVASMIYFVVSVSNSFNRVN